MDNIKLPSAETWSGMKTQSEPKSKKPTRANSFKSVVGPNPTAILGNTVPSQTPRGKDLQIIAQEEADQFISGMMRVEIDLFPNEFIQRNPTDFTSIPRVSKPEEHYNGRNTGAFHPIFAEDDSLALARTPESGNSNISGDEYSPAVTPVSSDQSLLHFLNDDSLPLEICDGALSQGALYGMEFLPQELFNYDSASWLSCFDP